MNLFALLQTISRAEFEPLPEFYSVELRELAYSMLRVDPKVYLYILYLLVLILHYN